MVAGAVPCAVAGLGRVKTMVIEPNDGVVTVVVAYGPSAGPVPVATAVIN